jgi:hypothetical protein
VSQLVPNLDALLKELPSAAPAHELACAFALGDEIEEVRGHLRATIARWLQEEVAEGGAAAPNA